MKSVYLSGPISGLSYAGATSWRKYATEQLKPIVGLSPLRDCDGLTEEQCLSHLGYPDKVLSTPKAIVTRDRFDCTRADVVLVNLKGATRVSIGTIIEIGWADAARIPIVLVMDDCDLVHEHAMVREMAGFVTRTLDEGISIVRTLLLEE